MLLETESCQEQATPKGACSSKGSAAARDGSDAGASCSLSSNSDSTTPKSGCPTTVLRASTPSLVAKDSRSLTFQWDRASLQDSYLVELQQMFQGEWPGRDGAASQGVWRKVYCGEESWAQVQGLLPGSLYAVRVWCEQEVVGGKAMSVSDVAMFRTTPARPSVPSSPLLAKKSRKALKLKWYEPHELGGAQPVHYSLEIQCPTVGSDSTEGFFEVFNGQANSFKVVGLVPGTKYSFRLRAYNEVGESDWSRISQYKTKKQIPRAPDCLCVVDAHSMEPNKKAVNLEWTCADIHSVDAQPVWYCVELQDMKTEATSTIHAYTPRAYIGGLIPRWRYSARVRALNKYGSSTWSNACLFKTCAPYPGVPSDLTVEDITNSTAKLTWGPPSHQSGSPVETYLINVLEVSNSLTQEAILRASYIVDQPGCHLSQLKCGRKYEVQLHAISREGYGLPAHINFDLLPSKPQSPSMPYADGRSAVTLNLKWETPECISGDSITYYHLEMRRTDITCGLLDLPDFEIAYKGAEPSANLEGLEPGGVYALRVKAENAFGFSDWSEVAYESTKSLSLEPPDPPVAAKCNANSIQVEWDSFLNPTGNGTYELESCCLLGGDVNPLYECVYEGTETAFEVQNLSSGQEYQFQLRVKKSTGVTPWSKPLTARTLETPPEAPEVRVKFQDSKSVTLEWISSRRTHEAQDSSFLVELGTQLGRKVKWEVAYDGTGSEWTFDDLSWRENHCVRVAERNAAGQGVFSSPVPVRVQMPLPGRPGKPSFSQLRHTSVRIQWSGPSAEHPGPAESYWLEAAEGQNDYGIVHRGHSTEHIVAPLVPGEAYKFRVCAENAAGRGDYSEPLELTAPLRNPRAPVGVSASVQGFDAFSSKQRVIACWQSKDHQQGYASPDHFVVQAAPRCAVPQALNSNGGCVITRSTNGNSCCLDGLLCGTEYAVRVKAAAGSTEHKCGNWSDSAFVTIPSKEKALVQLPGVKAGHAGWLEDMDETESEVIPAVPADSPELFTSSTLGCRNPARAETRSVPRAIVRSSPAGKPRPQRRKFSLWRALKSQRNFVAVAAVAAIVLALRWMN